MGRFGKRVLIVFTLCLVLFIHVACSENEQKHRLTFVEHPDNVVALPGDSVFFACKTESEDNKIWWLFNKTLMIRSSSEYKLSRNGAQLSFKVGSTKSIWIDQTGQYQCVSEQKNENNHREFVASLPGQLDVAFLEDFASSEKNQTIEVLEGNDVVIACNVPKSLPVAFVQFFKDGLVIENKNENGEILFIGNATSLDHSGNYTCSVYNHITNEKKISPIQTRLLVKSLSGNVVKSKLTFRPLESYHVLEGDELTVPCVASGSPNPKSLGRECPIMFN